MLTIVESSRSMRRRAGSPRARWSAGVGPCRGASRHWRVAVSDMAGAPGTAATRRAISTSGGGGLKPSNRLYRLSRSRYQLMAATSAGKRRSGPPGKVDTGSAAKLSSLAGSPAMASASTLPANGAIATPWPE